MEGEREEGKTERAFGLASGIKGRCEHRHGGQEEERDRDGGAGMGM